jgi:DNA invertase Pin-like site-specific DNA recombinase
MNEPTHFDLLTIGGGFAGPFTAVLEAGTDASYLMLAMPGGLAEFERDWIRAGTSEERERAKARGVKLGSQAETDRTPVARGDPATRLSTASRCETSSAATTCRTA